MYLHAADYGKSDGDNLADTREPTPVTCVLSRGSKRRSGGHNQPK